MRAFVVVVDVDVDVVVNHSWKASQGLFFGQVLSRLTLSLWLTQGKLMGSRNSNSRRRR